MKFVWATLLVSLCSCGVEPGVGGLTGSPFPTGNTVVRVACTQHHHAPQTVWKYIVISYPNETADVFCSIDWLRNRKRDGFPGDPDGALRRCVLDEWEFTHSPKPRLRFTGLGQGTHPDGSILPLSFEFTNCITTEWNDPDWAVQEYFLGEGAI